MIDDLNKLANRDQAHTFQIDTGKKKYVFSAATRYIVDMWVEAIRMSRKTSKERSLSITGDFKNIFKIITLYENDREALDAHIKEKTDKFIPPD